MNQSRVHSFWEGGPAAYSCGLIGEIARLKRLIEDCDSEQQCRELEEKLREVELQRAEFRHYGRHFLF